MHQFCGLNSIAYRYLISTAKLSHVTTKPKQKINEKEQKYTPTSTDFGRDALIISR